LSILLPHCGQVEPPRNIDPVIHAEMTQSSALLAQRARFDSSQARHYHKLQASRGAMARIIERYLSFDGRLARLPYFARNVSLGVAAVALGMTSIPLFVQGGPWWWIGIVVLVAVLALIVVGGVSLTVRRLHDLGLSGYHAIWVGAAGVGWEVLSHGPPKTVLAGLPLAAVSAWLTFWPGNRGVNRFGERPI
jgi:uncharacterized membrane protein YhaH (DUF805 family)